MRRYLVCCFFFFNDTATTEIYTLSLHDALPICPEAEEHRVTNETGDVEREQIREDIAKDLISRREERREYDEQGGSDEQADQNGADVPEPTFPRQLLPLDVPTDEQHPTCDAAGCGGHAGAQIVEQAPAAQPPALEARRRP